MTSKASASPSAAQQRQGSARWMHNAVSAAFGRNAKPPLKRKNACLHTSAVTFLPDPSVDSGGGVPRILMISVIWWNAAIEREKTTNTRQTTEHKEL